MPLTLLDVCDRDHNGSVQLTGRRFRTDGSTSDLGLRGRMVPVRSAPQALRQHISNDLRPRLKSGPSQNLRESQFFRKV